MANSQQKDQPFTYVDFPQMEYTFEEIDEAIKAWNVHHRLYANHVQLVVAKASVWIEKIGTEVEPHDRVFFGKSAANKLYRLRSNIKKSNHYGR